MSESVSEGSVSRPDDGANSREEAIRSDLVRRLRRVCENFPEEDFRKLVHKMAERQLRAERGKPLS